MEEIAISRFKATCLAVPERVRRTGQPVRITRYGTPVADVLPIGEQVPRGNWLGFMRASGARIGDQRGAPGLGDTRETLREWDEVMAETADRAQRARRSGT